MRTPSYVLDTGGSFAIYTLDAHFPAAGCSTNLSVIGLGKVLAGLLVKGEPILRS